MQQQNFVILLISSDQHWLAQLTDTLSATNRQLVQQHFPEGRYYANVRPTEPTAGPIADLIRTIANLQPNILLLDQNGLSEDLSAVFSSSPATRRITQRVVSNTDDGVVNVKDEIAQLETQREPVIDCQRPLLPEAIDGIALFNAGNYYKAHDPLEEAWNHEAAPDRDLYRALLQVSVSYHHITKGNYRGAVKLLLRAKQWLAKLPDQCRGVDIGAFRKNAVAVETILLSLGPDNIADFDVTLIEPIIYTAG